MTQKWTFIVTLRKKGKERFEKRVFENVVSYNFVGNGSQFYLELKAELKEPTPDAKLGYSEYISYWWPMGQILQIKSIRQNIFENHKEKQDAIRQAMGLKPKNKPEIAS